MRIGQKVDTPDGPGTVMIKEKYGSRDEYRAGVKHDVFPANKPRMYTDDILYYHPKEITDIKEPQNAR